MKSYPTFRWLAVLLVLGAVGYWLAVSRSPRVVDLAVPAVATPKTAGAAQVGRFADPVMGGTFCYAPAGSGFELSSAFEVKGKALKMSFAAPK